MILDALRSLFRRRAKLAVNDTGLPDAADVISAIFFKEARQQEVHMAHTRRIVDDLSFGTVNGVSAFIHPSNRRNQ